MIEIARKLHFLLCSRWAIMELSFGFRYFAGGLEDERFFLPTSHSFKVRARNKSRVLHSSYVIVYMFVK